jgi:hypothetical protein
MPYEFITTLLDFKGFQVSERPFAKPASKAIRVIAPR